MSPARQPNGSPRRRKIGQTPIGPTFQTERSAIIPRVAAKKRRDFDPTFTTIAGCKSTAHF